MEDKSSWIAHVHSFPVGVSAAIFQDLELLLQKYEAVIGLEVHCQLAANTKLFSSAPSASRKKEKLGAQASESSFLVTPPAARPVSVDIDPNTNIDAVTLALPGTLPVLNEKCVDLAIRMGLAVGASVQPVSVFVRKNYFYPDLPKGYQITQFDRPICLGGHVLLSNGTDVKIDRIQIEEDAGKTIHGIGESLVDFNRAGVGLIEIVSEPSMRSPFEASEYLRKLHRIAVHFGVTGGDLERGNFRADANVSVRLKGQAHLETRTEIKNLNSFKFLERAIGLEIIRQIECKEAGEPIILETRGYDSERDCTYSMRSKETAQDYRYFPDPDLPALIVSQERINKQRGLVLEDPFLAFTRLIQERGVGHHDADKICELHERVCYFDRLDSFLKKASSKTAASFLSGLSEFPLDIEPSWLAEALDAVARGSVSLKTLKDFHRLAYLSAVGPHCMSGSQDLQSFVVWAEKNNQMQISGEGAVEALAHALIKEFPLQAEELRRGKDKVMTFFVGQGMKRTRGSVHPEKLADAIHELLKHD